MKMGRCDCCGEIRVLHRTGEFLICDYCEMELNPAFDRGEEE